METRLPYRLKQRLLFYGELFHGQGTTYAELSLSNPVNLDIGPMNVRALVHTGALHLCIPQHVAIQLDLRELESREVTLGGWREAAGPLCGTPRGSL